MNKKGFTLIELIATIVVLGIVVGITVVGINYNIDNAKKKSENVFIGTLMDAIEMYFDDNGSVSKLNWSANTVGTIDKVKKSNVPVYEASSLISFENIIESKYSPILESDLINPATKKKCTSLNAIIHIYKDADEVYYYYISRSLLVDADDEHSSCLLDSDETYISNLPDTIINNFSYWGDKKWYY